jgi:uncharacterized protein with PIN domain
MGFSCQSKKLRRCKTCGEELVIDKNWTIKKKISSHYDCNFCDNERRKKFGIVSKDRLRYTRSKKGKYLYARARAKQRGVVWSLTKEEYIRLVENNCHYCGDILRETGVGLDQIVPTKGYTTNNVVPCCKECNVVKSDYFTYEEMVEIGKLLKDIKSRRKTQNF